MTELLGMMISPWTEKARWALDHHGVDYRFSQYTPMVGEPALRVRLKRPFGAVSVPVLFEDGRAIRDSYAIARHVDGRGAGARLFPEEHAADIGAWNDRSEAALSAARALSMPRMVSGSGVFEEAMPSFMPDAVRAHVGGLVGLGFAYVRSKYGAQGDGEGPRRTLAAALGTLREALGGRPYLHEGFTFADVAMASVFQGVKPVDDAYVPIGPATRAAFTHEDIAGEFADLVAWRDGLYAKHRPRRR